MKSIRYTLYFIAALCLNISVDSCQKETYEPEAPLEGAQYYFSNEEKTAISLSPTTTYVDVTVYRIVKDMAADLTVDISDASGIVTPVSSLTASFAAGNNTTTISLPVELDNLEYGIEYPIVLSINDETTPWGISSLTLTLTYPIPLTSLGKGVFTDDWYFEEYTSSPEILQSDIDPNEFHIKTPYADISGGGDDLVFKLTQAGMSYNGVEATLDNLIYYEPTFTGYTDLTYDDDIYLLHPSNFSAGRVDSYWVHNKVISWQENGLPAVVQIAPYYYMYNVGGFNASQTDNAITIVFPGVVLKDYSVSATYSGYFTSSENEIFGIAEVVFGDDVESGLAVLVPGKDPQAGLDLIKAGDESVVPFTGSEVRLPLPEGAGTGSYTIVVASVVDGKVQESSHATFFYQAGEITIDWTWLEGEWDGLDYNYYEEDFEGDAYPMTIEKVDDTHCLIYNIWGSEGVLEGVVDFENLTITIPGYQNVFAMPQYGCDMYFVAVDPDNDYEVFEDLMTAVVAKISPSGIVIDNYDFLMVGGNYDGFTYDGGIRTTMTK